MEKIYRDDKWAPSPFPFDFYGVAHKRVDTSTPNPWKLAHDESGNPRVFGSRQDAQALCDALNEKLGKEDGNQMVYGITLELWLLPEG